MGPTWLRLAKPVIAAVSGYAVAGGLELALWCDLRAADETPVFGVFCRPWGRALLHGWPWVCDLGVASDAAVFGVFCRRWGVPLIDGGTVRLPRLIGTSRAMDMILTGRAVDAAAAAAHGRAHPAPAPR